MAHLARSTSQWRPLCPFLLPALLPAIPRRSLATTASSSLTESREPEQAPSQVKPKKPPRPLSAAESAYLSSALRVNHAGELAATRIYTAQNPIVTKAYPHLRNLMKHMHDQEAGHFRTFNHLLAKHQIRPTAMYPLWQVASTALGWGTAMMGREAAMACTEAVETEIGGHYNSQVRAILKMVREREEAGEEVDPDLRQLLETVRKIRDEELEHLDHAVENDAKLAKPYAALTNIIRVGCRAAIKVSERI